MGDEVGPEASSRKSQGGILLVAILPEAYGVPIFYPGEDIKNLQYAPLLYQVNKRCLLLLDFEREVRLALSNVGSKSDPFDGKEVDASSLGWTISAFSSRAFRLNGRNIGDKSSKDSPGMLPLIDMCNHSFSPNARIVQKRAGPTPERLLQKQGSTQMILCSSTTELQAMIYSYWINGFVVPSNPYDKIELKYDGALLDAASMADGATSPRFSSQVPWQREILYEFNLGGESSDLKVTLGGSDVIEGWLLAALRVLFESDASKSAET